MCHQHFTRRLLRCSCGLTAGSWASTCPVSPPNDAARWTHPPETKIVGEILGILVSLPLVQRHETHQINIFNLSLNQILKNPINMT